MTVVGNKPETDASRRLVCTRKLDPLPPEPDTLGEINPIEFNTMTPRYDKPVLQLITKLLLSRVKSNVMVHVSLFGAVPARAKIFADTRMHTNTHTHTSTHTAKHRLCKDNRP
jgi:hypothetical protein